MKRKSLSEAIAYVTNLKTPELFYRGRNYAVFNCPVYGMFGLVYSYEFNKWWAYLEHGSDNKGYTYQTLFYID